MKVALTGASGFLGRHLIDRLCQDEHEVVALSRSPHESADPSIRWLQGDLRSDDAVNQLVSSADAVIHAALDRGDDRFMDHPGDPVDYFDANVIGSLRVLNAADHANLERVVFISSGAVHQHVCKDIPLDENHPLRPGAIYGAAKASVETLIHAYGLSGRLAACTLRPPTIYGVADPVSDSRWFGLIRDVVMGKDVAATGGGKVVHVDDLARAAVSILQCDTQLIAGKTFNVCDGFVSEHEVASLAMEAASSQSKIAGPAKKESNAMSTTAIQRLGIRFGGKPRLHDTVAAIVRQIQSGV